MECGQTHPLLLPEFLHELGAYFQKDVIFSCMQVSKLWHRAFLPRLWSSISLDGKDTSTEEATTDTMYHTKRNAARIESLHLLNLKEDCTNQLLELDYPILDTLSLKFTRGQEILPAIKDMIIRHGPRLTSLNFRYSVVDPSVFQVFDLLEGCKDHGRLRSLFLGVMMVDISAMDARSRQLLWSLDTLEMDCVDVVDCNRVYWSTQGKQPPALLTASTGSKKSPSILSNKTAEEDDVRDNVPSKVRDLTVNASETGLRGDYEHFLGCQELRSMAWIDRRFPYRETPTLAADLQKGLWPRLDSLCLRIKRLTDRDIADIILALGNRPMKLLELNDTAFGPLSAGALLYGKIADDEDGSESEPAKKPIEIPRPSLETLYVRNTKCNGIWMQRFLCLYSNLKEFVGTFMSDRDMVNDPRPWACLNLVHFNLDIRREVYNALDPELLELDDGVVLYSKPPTFVFNQIATLTRLEDLILSEKCLFNDDFHSFELRWDMPGISVLEPLSRLMVIYWFHVEEKDAEYIEETWPCLTRVITRIIDDDARAFLEDNGITVVITHEPESDEPPNPLENLFNAILGHPN